MNRIIGFLIVMFAFFVAMFFIITKRNLNINSSKTSSFYKRKFLAILAILVTFLSTGKIFATANEKNIAIDSKSLAEKENQEDIEKTKEWKELKERWSTLKEAKYSKAIDFDDFKKEIEKQKKANAKCLTVLVSKNYISQNVAYILNYIYSELLYHRLRSTSNWTCYKMTQLGSAMAGARSDLENRLKVLTDLKEAAIDTSVLKEAKDNIARDVEFMNRAQRFFDRYDNNQHDETFWEEEKALANLFKDKKIKDSIKIEEDALRTAELIVKLSKNYNEYKNMPKLKPDQLKSFEGWNQIKSNWQSASTMEAVRYDDISKTVEEKKKVNWILLSKLVSAGLFSQKGAGVFNAIYADRIYHRLRPMAATCYEPTILGTKQSSVRNDIENRLKELDQIAKEDKVNTEVINQAKRNLEKDMEVVLLINDLWDTGKSTNWGEKYQEEEKNLLSYFVDEGWGRAEIKDDLKVRESIKEAMEIIQLLYAD